MYDPRISHHLPHLGAIDDPLQERPARSRHDIQLAAYAARRRERLALEKAAARSPHPARLRYLAAGLARSVARLLRQTVGAFSGARPGRGARSGKAARRTVG